MSALTDELSELIPAIYRQLDAQRGEPLRALMDVLAEQGAVVEEDIAGLYDSWFVETCAEWVVPYIGDLLGVRGLREISEGTPFTRRALVANTLRYRRRKGTCAVLEQLAFDATGWRARAVEFFELLEATQYVNHIRLHARRTPDLRNTDTLQLVGTAFDSSPRTVDVRNIRTGRGRHNIPNVGIFVWRLQSYRLLRAAMREADAPDRFTVNSLGLNAPLFNPPQTESDLLEPTGEHHVPVPVRPRLLYDELEQRRQALVDQRVPIYRYFDDRADARAGQVFELFLDGKAVPPERLMICNLSAWQAPPDTRDYVRQNPDGTTTSVPLPISAAVDPALGRLVLAPAAVGTEPRLTASYGFAGDLGGGSYERQESVPETFANATWQVGVSRELSPTADQIFETLSEAVDAWNAQPGGTVGVIAIMDSSRYEQDLTGAARIRIPEGSRLLIVAADWPERPMPDAPPGATERLPGDIDADGRRPTLTGSIDVQGTSPNESQTPGELAINGILIEGNLQALSGHLGQLRIAHSTIVPDSFSLRVPSENPDLQVHLERVICGQIGIEPVIDGLLITDCVIQASGGAIIARRTQATICSSTILGTTDVLGLNATDSIFTNIVNAERRQQGCLRYCVLPQNSATPRRFRCQPDLALKEAPADSADQLRASLVPTFNSTQYGDPDYVQLSTGCAEQITIGAEDGAEMGVFSFLKQPQRMDNLRAAVGSYVRFGLETAVLFEN